MILSHFEEHIWPRTISTRATGGGQRLVNSKQEALAWYKAANLLDFSISGYPSYTDYYVNRTGIAPSLLLVDIDRAHLPDPNIYEALHIAQPLTPIRGFGIQE